MSTKIFCFISICFFISLSSCGQHIQFGIYERTGTNEKFQVSKDSTFEYSLTSGYTKLYSSGKWFLEKGKNNNLLLNSYYAKDDYPVFVEERSSDLKKNFIEVRIPEFYARSKDTVLWMSIIINDSLIFEVKDSISQIPIGIDNLRKIQLIFYYNNFLSPELIPVKEYTKHFRTKVLNVQNINANIFVITYPKIDLKMFDFYEFKNERLVISNKKLEWVQKNKIYNLK